MNSCAPKGGAQLISIPSGHLLKKQILIINLRQQAGPINPGHGYLIIVAHHVDLTVGDIAVIPVSR